MKSTRRQTADERFMRRAIELAERGLGETNPNPAVGCVLVRGGVVVGEGFHRRAGSLHAEASALTAAGEDARGATAYVTLEPCVPHAGKRTPACAPRLIDAGVRRVVLGVRDFNPRVCGDGIRRLRSAGIEVVEGVGGPAASRLAQHFNTAMRSRRPFIVLKAGVTLDGRIATAAGESKWITSGKQRSAARRLRRLFDGVLIGVETAIKDDPRLLPSPRTLRSCTRVVLDSFLRLPLHSELVRTARQSPVLVVCTTPTARKRRAFEDLGVEVVCVPESGGRVSIPVALRALFARGLNSLMVEGGSEVMGSFVRDGAFDEVVIFRAPLILGGRDSRPVVGGENPTAIADAIRMIPASREDCATLRYGFADVSDLGVEVYHRRGRGRAVRGRPR